MLPEKRDPARAMGAAGSETRSLLGGLNGSKITPKVRETQEQFCVRTRDHDGGAALDAISEGTP